MTQRSVTYARVSTDEQAKGYSLTTQLSACRDWAERNGFIVVREFQDDYTGASMDRPGLNELRQFLKEDCGVAVVVVLDVDRLARKSVYQMLIEDELKRLGANVEYVSGQYADNDEGRLQKQIRGAIAEYEKAKIIERSKRGKRGKAQAGHVITGARPPYGYYVISEPHKARLEVNDEEARIVRLIFEWYLNGDGQSRPLSLEAIASKLTALHVPTRGDIQASVYKKRAAGIWASATVHNILTNETYTGVWHFGKTRIVSDEEAHKLKKKRGPRKPANERSQTKRSINGEQVARPRSEWVAVSVPSIIDRATFDAAQVRMAYNRAMSPRSRKYDYLLGSRLRCGNCGYSFCGRTRRDKHFYYYCKGKETHASECAMPTFNGAQVEATVWVWLRDLLKNPEKISEGLAAEREESARKYAPLQERLALIESRLVETQAEQAELLGLYLSRKFKPEILDARKAQLDKTEADLSRERTELTDYLKYEMLTSEQAQELELMLGDIREGLDSATREDVREYFDLLNVRGTLAVENNERIVYIKCLLSQQPVSLALTSPLSNIGATGMNVCACPSTLPFP